MNFINLSFASSITCAVMVAIPRSFATRSISLRAMGRMKSGIFSSRFSASGVQVIPLLDETYPTIQLYQEIAGRIRTLLDYKKVLADKL